MGIGDEIMAMGDAKRYVTEHQCERVAIVDRNGNRRCHYLWAQCRYIAGPNEQVAHQITHGGNARPYIDYQATTPIRWAWNYGYRVAAAEMPWIKKDERARGLILVEPGVKASASPNKQWGRWQELIDAEPGLPWAQLGQPGTNFLRGVQRLTTANFIEACALLRAAWCAVLPEGGLHHAAAALKCPAVVLFGAYIPASITGYQQHVNLTVDDPLAHGWRITNSRCEAAWKQITTQDVLAALKPLIAQRT